MEAGAKGGKLLGAGGGGFILLYCDEQYQDQVRQALGLKEVDFELSTYGSRVVYFSSKNRWIKGKRLSFLIGMEL